MLSYEPMLMKALSVRPMLSREHLSVLSYEPMLMKARFEKHGDRVLLFQCSPTSRC